MRRSIEHLLHPPVMLLIAAVLVATGAGATVGARSASSIRTASPTKAKKLQDPETVLVAAFVGAGTTASCELAARNRDRARKGVKGLARIRLVDAESGDLLADLGTTKRRTKRTGLADFPISLGSLQGSTVGIVAQVDVRGGKKATDIVWSCTIGDDPSP